MPDNERMRSLLFISTRVSTTSVVNHFDKIHTEEQAFEVVSRLSCDERKLLHAALQSTLHADKGQSAAAPEGNEDGVQLTSEQAKVFLNITVAYFEMITADNMLSTSIIFSLSISVSVILFMRFEALFLINTLPFVGFGCLDNMLMIVAGEYIDQSLGAWICLSTMAAAALGNTISDVAGVGLAHYVEIGVGWFGIRHPVLTAKQLDSGRARLLTNFGRAFGLTIGCLIGMFPLMFYREEKKEVKET